ncbi:hypothetical protein RFI_11282, partial [Reticulomyxa filosa]
MQLTKTEISETHLIVTTPEKWDVITRKSDELVSVVKLLILDEVHLLHDDRGSVLEALVARTIRLVEVNQSMIRIVGLSATLPNYQDVATFLRAETGVLYFDRRYRPVPLSMGFIGAFDSNAIRQRNIIDLVCFEKAKNSVKEGHQCMVFVHSRKETIKTCEMLDLQFQKDKSSEILLPDIEKFHSEWEKITKRAHYEINNDLRNLLRKGFGAHHAGMPRHERTLVERLFEIGFIRILCCTATLAWGVNLPAHTVIIKGTQIYDTKKGGFVDVGILDVMQIFGRAGRPQYDTSGEAFIITDHDKVRQYQTLLTHQLPIESNFINELPNHLNAEIVLGSVTNLNEAIMWLTYTYLYVRMLKNPLAYGVSFEELSEDPHLYLHRKKLLEDAALTLAKHKMARFEYVRLCLKYSILNFFKNILYIHIYIYTYMYIFMYMYVCTCIYNCTYSAAENFFPTDIGRIASHYYIDFETVGTWNETLKPRMSIEEILKAVCSATEFKQLKVREDEESELAKLYNTSHCCPYKVLEDHREPVGKSIILLQVHIGRQAHLVRHQTLRNDLLYIDQNAPRVARALFEIALRMGWGALAFDALQMCQVIEHKVWHHLTPLRQFVQMKPVLASKIESTRLKIEDFDEYNANDLGQLIRESKAGQVVKRLASTIPRVDIEAVAKPITRTLLAVDINVTPLFRWIRNQHGTTQSFWLWVDDAFNDTIYHYELYSMSQKDYQESDKEPLKVAIVLPVPEQSRTTMKPSQYQIHMVSDFWLGSHALYSMSFQHLILPDMYPPETELLDLNPLPSKALQNEQFEKLFGFKYFNPIQTQVFFVAYRTDNNILLGAPTGSGKTVIAELCLMRQLQTLPEKKTIYIAPLKALARERYKAWKDKFGDQMNLKVIMLTGDMTPDRKAIDEANIIITTPEKWDGVSRYWRERSYVRKVGLIVLDEIHLLGLDRGPILEVIVSRLKFVQQRSNSKVRLLGLSTALANAEDLGDWLEVGRLGLFNFPASQRPVPCTVHINGYPGKHYCPRMQTMNKPTYHAIKSYSPQKPVLVFVSSRRQTRLTAIDLISFVCRDQKSSQ